MTELRTFNIQAQVDGKSGLTELRQLTAAIKDTDTVTEALKKQLGEETQVTIKNVKTKRELSNEARRLVTQMARNERKTEQLTQAYQNQARMLSMTADEQEQYRAVLALGSTATDAQREAVRQSVIQYQQLSAAQGKQQKSLRGSRGIMQNFGWQLQDTIVQLQMGTNAFTVLSQQGSQMAAAFGPRGAIIGAGIALAGVIGGTLLASMNDATAATERLTDALKIQNEVVKTSDEGVAELTKKYSELYKRDQLLARLKLTSALVSSQDVIKASGKEISDSYSEISTGLRNIDVNVDQLDKNSRLKIRSFLNTLNQLNNGTLTASGEELENIITSIQEGSRVLIDSGASGTKFNSFITSLVSNLERIRTSKDAIDLYQRLLNNPDSLDDEVNRNKRTKLQKKELREFNSLVKSMTKDTQDEYDRRYKIIQNYADNEGADQKRVAEAYIELEVWKTKETSKEYDKREKERLRIQKAQSKTLAGGSGLNLEDETYNNNLKTLADQRITVRRNEAAETERIEGIVAAGNGDIVQLYMDLDDAKNQSLAEQQRINLLIEAEHLRHEQKLTDLIQDEYDKREKVRLKIQRAQSRLLRGQSGLDLEDETYNNNLKTLADQRIAIRKTESDQIERIERQIADGTGDIVELYMQMDEAKNSSVAEQQRINALIEAEEARHGEAISQLLLKQASDRVQGMNVIAQSITSIGTMLATGADQVRSQTQEMDGFQKTMFLSTQALAAAMAFINGVQMGTELAKNAAFLDWTGMTSAAMIQFGTTVGLTQAAVIMGTTFAGAFDKGGYIPSGQIGIMSEYGSEIANGALVQGPAQITSREDTAKMLNGGNLNVKLVNQIPDAAYNVNQIDEQTVEIIATRVFNQRIDRGVAGVIGNSNTKTSKAFRDNWKVGRNFNGR